jgi:hypothetical protein
MGKPLCGIFDLFADHFCLKKDFRGFLFVEGFVDRIVNIFRAFIGFPFLKHCLIVSCWGFSWNCLNFEKYQIKSECEKC